MSRVIALADEKGSLSGGRNADLLVPLLPTAVHVVLRLEAKAVVGKLGKYSKD